MSRFTKIVLLVLFCVALSYQQSCSITYNQDISLPDLAARSGQPQSNCCNICQNTPGCKGFAWNAYEGGTCWLKAGTGPLIAKDNVNVGILGSTSSTSLGGGCSIRRNQDIGLPDLAAHHWQPESNCCNICQNTPGCKGFAWNAYEGGTCWLKAGTGPLIAKANVNVGILGSTGEGVGGDLGGSLGGGCSIRSNQDIGLPDLAAHHSQPQENCCNICRTTPKCKGFAWNAYQGGTCWLKDGTSPLVAKDGVNVGIMGGGSVEVEVEFGCGNSCGGSGLVTFDEFANAVVNSNGFPRPTQEQYNAFIQGLPNGFITTKEEAAMALTHLIHESDGLRAKREYMCQNSGCPGQYRTDGCDATGQNYFGRGYIQLSWCYNYRTISQDLFKDERLVSDPDMVARDENVAWNTAFSFWKLNVHNRIGVAEGDFGVTTRAINGGIECDNSAGHTVAKHRFEMYGRVRAAFGLGGAGDERGCYN